MFHFHTHIVLDSRNFKEENIFLFIPFFISALGP